MTKITPLFLFFSSIISFAVTSDPLPDLVEKVLPGVVNISSTTIINYQVYGWENFLQHWGIPPERKQTSLGSGFIIDEAGYILTNNHVVAQADEVLVILQDKRQYKAKIIGKDSKMDIALILIKDKGGTVPSTLVPIKMGNSDTVRIAESVFAVGNPFGLQHTVTKGIISAKNRTIGLGPFDNFLQTDATINPGNSGGPLFNLNPEVIGMNTVIYSRTGQSGGIGFAIPINEAKMILPDLKRYGRVPRPWLGILAEKVTPALQFQYGLGASKGVLVYNLVQDGPSDSAGLQQGDILLSIDQAAVEERYDVERLLAKHRPKETIALKILRKRKPLELKVKLEEFPHKIENLPQGII